MPGRKNIICFFSAILLGLFLTALPAYAAGCTKAPDGANCKKTCTTVQDDRVNYVALLQGPCSTEHPLVLSETNYVGGCAGSVCNYVPSQCNETVINGECTRTCINPDNNQVQGTPMVIPAGGGGCLPSYEMDPNYTFTSPDPTATVGGGSGGGSGTGGGSSGGGTGGGTGGGSGGVGGGSTSPTSIGGQKATFQPVGVPGPFCTPGINPLNNCLPYCCPLTPELIKAEFTKLNNWTINTYWKMIQAQIAEVTSKINAGQQQQTTLLGSFAQGQEALKSQGSLQKGAASAASHQASSEALCRYATLSQELSATDAIAYGAKQSISRAGIDRQILIENSASSQTATGKPGETGLSRGQAADKISRWGEYVSTFCDPSDISTGKDVCQGSKDTQYNSDINFSRTAYEPMTLNLTPASDEKIAVMALFNNLYANDLVNNIPPATFDTESEENATQAKKYMNFLSAVAKHSVAQNSFANIVGMKAQGSGGNAKYIKKLMVELGLSEEDADKMITDNPSYYAQMEVLTRRMQQSPSFFVNLMEGPINVKRQQTALKSFELMQQRDMYKSIQRSEMLMATLLELKLSASQGELNKQLGKSK